MSGRGRLPPLAWLLLILSSAWAAAWPAMAETAETAAYAEPHTGMVFVAMPEGCFDMGAAPGEPADPDERQVHRVCLSRFWMGRTEVTQGQYRRFDPDHRPRNFQGRVLAGKNLPVVDVDWDSATAFGRWLTERHGGRRVFGLPTEAQWEYACRAGGSGLAPWGDDPARACRFANLYDAGAAKALKFEWPHFPCSDGFAATAPAGRFAPNDLGLLDMLGNVWEWCRDGYRPGSYAHHARRDPVDALPSMSRVVRGGGWSDEPANVRPTHRDGYWAGFRGAWVGFRLVMTENGGPPTAKPDP